jgi:imidazolonepropionase-like amidohydrolase
MNATLARFARPAGPAAICLISLLVPAKKIHAQGPVVAITNARIHTAAGPVIERGTVVIRDGRIIAAGAAPVPAGARVIDAAGKTITPGLLDSSTSVGIVEIGLEDNTNDAVTSEDRITASFNVLDAINPASTLIPVTRIEGITRVVVQPQAGSSLIAGTGVLMDLGGDRVSRMLKRAPTAVYAVLGEAGAAAAGGSRAAAAAQLREVLQDARDFAINREAWERNQRRDYAISRLDLEALAPVLTGEVPLAIQVHRASDILATLRLAREFNNMRIILLGATEGWMVARDIAAANVPVIINPMQNIPGFENLGITLENAARLERAGVLIAFGSFDAHNSRNLKQLAGNAISYGMPHDAALRAVTVNAARIWGIADTYGTLQPGRDADLVVWSGDPFELSTRVEHVFIRGEEIPLDSRQKELFRRYRTLENGR